MTEPVASPDDPSGAVALTEAADQLGVHYMTAYRYVRTGKLFATKRSGQWWVDPADLAAFGSEAAEPVPSRPREQLIKPLTNRLLAGDTAGSWNLVDEALRGGAKAADIHLTLLSPSMHAIGQMWADGKISIMEEHRATTTAHRLLGRISPLFKQRGRRRGAVVIGTASGDPHALPSAILSDLLSDRRLDVVDLGANTPAESFVEAANEADGLVGIGVCLTLDELVEPTVELLATVRSACPDTLLLVGGPAVSRNGTSFEGVADHVTSTAAEVCDLFEGAANTPAVSETGDIETPQRASG